jgi:hypothetical protein
MIGPAKFPRYLEQQQLAQGRRLDTLASTAMNGLAVRATEYSAGGYGAESIVAVGNSQAARQFDCRTQVATSSTIGAAGYNAAAVTYSSAWAGRYMAVGSTEAVYESSLGTSWTLVSGSASGSRPLFDIDAAPSALQYALAVGGNSAADAIYQLRTASAITLSTAPDLFTRVKWHNSASRFIVAGATTIRAFNPSGSTTTLLDTHPEGTCTVLDMFFDPMTDSMHVLLRLPSGAIRCTLVRGSSMTITRSAATTTTFTSATVMRGIWTRYNGPYYLFSGDGASPRATAGLLSSAAAPSTPELNLAYDPLVAPIAYPGIVADSLLRACVRVNNIIFAIAQGGSTEHRLYQLSDLLAPAIP